MAVTGACAEIVYLDASPLEPDHDAPVSYADLAAVVEEQTEPLAADEHVDIDPRGNDAFRP